MNLTPVSPNRSWGFLCAVSFIFVSAISLVAEEPLFKKGDRIALLGGTLASRAGYSGHIEAVIQRSFPDLNLTVRNMGWSGDEVDLMPRPLNFGSLEEHLSEWDIDVVVLCFGGNEAFKGEENLDAFIAAYRELIERLKKQTDRFIFVSPTAHEKLSEEWPDPTARNAILQKYTAAIKSLSEEVGNSSFVDLFHPTRTLMAENYNEKLTINGIHLTDDGYRLTAQVIATALEFPNRSSSNSTDELRELIIEKNRQFFLRWRPVNGEYIFGRRNKPYGIVSYPPEMEQLEKQIAELDTKIRNAAAQ